MTEEEIAALEDTLSLERFGRYLTWADGDRLRAVELYTLNSQLSESLYTPLHMLEVALRNRIHAVASAEPHGDPALPWFNRPEYQKGSRQAEQLEKAKAELTESGRSHDPGRVVAALTFGYWTAFFGKDYETLWQQLLHKIARRADGKGLRRKDFSEPLARLRMLRNRIAHHEPILNWNLPKHHGKIIELTEWLSPAGAAWCRTYGRFSAVYPASGIELARPAPEFVPAGPTVGQDDTGIN
ncbi:Abi family protein [Rubellimicrobium aerolatum]|uniref:Abi family protein n=1 Tax=Rubellimicrobium aerolatum TaxID=490979 RepID=A0ABW0SEJ0_9RHOB|nr:Abi family protein [Rubellimicrobium aerolatum]MBP1806877.1 hypothetical protein [Rubellimicrobium aerolatum]